MAKVNYAVYGYEEYCYDTILFQPSYDKFLKVEVFKNNKTVRGNTYELDKFSGQFKTGNDFYEEFIVGQGRQQEVFEYVSNGTTMVEIRKTLRDDVITFTYSKYVAESYTGNICERHRTDEFQYVVEAEDGTFPENGERDGSWFVKKGDAGTHTVVNIDDGDVLPKYNSKGDTLFVLKWYPYSGNDEARYYLEYTYEDEFGDDWEEFPIPTFNVDGIFRVMGIGTSRFKTDTPIQMRMSALSKNGELLYKSRIGEVTFVENVLPNKPITVFPKNNLILDGYKDVELKWMFLPSTPTSKQSKAEVYVDYGTGSDVFKVYGTTNRFVLPSEVTRGGTLDSPKEISWRVVIFDEYGIPSENVNIRDRFFTANHVVAPRFYNEEEVEYISESSPNLTIYCSPNTGNLSATYSVYNRRGERLWRNGVSLKPGFNIINILDDNDVSDRGDTFKDGEEYSVIVENIRGRGYSFEPLRKTIVVNYSNNHISNSIIVRKSESTGKSVIYLDLNNNLSNFERVRFMRRNESTGTWEYVSEWSEWGSQNTKVLDVYPLPGSTEYRASIENKKGQYKNTDSVVVYHNEYYPSIANVSKNLDPLRIWDIVKTDVSESSESGFHQVVGSRRPLVETSVHSKKTLDITWEVSSLEDRTKYLEYLDPRDVYVYRDKEGRSLFFIIEDIRESEYYNPLRWSLSLKGTEVEYYESYVEEGGGI